MTASSGRWSLVHRPSKTGRHSRLWASRPKSTGPLNAFGCSLCAVFRPVQGSLRALFTSRIAVTFSTLQCFEFSSASVGPHGREPSSFEGPNLTWGSGPDSGLRTAWTRLLSLASRAIGLPDCTRLNSNSPCSLKDKAGPQTNRHMGTHTHGNALDGEARLPSGPGA